MQANFRKRKNERGFTILELLIAMTVFSVVLLIFTTGLLQITRVYYKGITSAKTQEAARVVMDEISRNIQFKGGAFVPPNGTTPQDRFCVGDKRFTYLIDRQLHDAPSLPDQRRNVIVMEDIIGSCDASPHNLDAGAANPGTNLRELLSPYMRIARLQVTTVAADTYRVNLRIVYGDNDLLNATRDGCGSLRLGTQFCATSELTTHVRKRVE